MFRPSDFGVPGSVIIKDNHMGRCQNYGPFLGTLNIRCRIIIWTQKGTIILTTTHMGSLRVCRGCQFLRPGFGSL